MKKMSPRKYTGFTKIFTRSKILNSPKVTIYINKHKLMVQA